MDEYLRFENAIFCSSSCNFFEIFCSQPVFITDIFLLFQTFCDPHCEHELPDTYCIVNKIPTP